MELKIAIIGLITGVLSAIITSVAYVYAHFEAVREKNKAKKDNVRRRLALQIIGYHCEESLLAEELAIHTGETPKQVKERIRKAAVTHDENKEQVYPKMTAKEAREYIVE